LGGPGREVADRREIAECEDSGLRNDHGQSAKARLFLPQTKAKGDDQQHRQQSDEEADAQVAEPEAGKPA
jgi:hypothetical protein